MTDHKKEAIESLDGLGYTGDEAYVGQAQVHATLYLAEQQRIANLIAFVHSISEEVGNNVMPDYKVIDKAQEATKQVFEGLGL